MIDCLAEIVQQAGALGHANVHTKLGSHDCAKLRHLDRVLQNVLSKRGAVAKGAKGLDDLRMKIVNAGVEACLLARFTNALLNQIGSFLIHLLDARRMDATVCDKVLESACEPSHDEPDRS